MVEHVLTDPTRAATVLAHATRLVYDSEDVIVDIGGCALPASKRSNNSALTPSLSLLLNTVGRCINAIASDFAVMPQCSRLPSDCFACIIRTAR